MSALGYQSEHGLARVDQRRTRVSKGDEAAAKTEGAPHEESANQARLEIWAGNLRETDHRQHLVGRVGRGEDIAEAIEYAMGAGFMSGQVKNSWRSPWNSADCATGDDSGWRGE